MSTQGNSVAEQEPSASLGGSPRFPGRYAHFGRFEADLERGDLFQNGQRVKVQAKLFQALVLLLSRAGDVVTREDVRRHLWPDSFLANLDANVNTTMNKLRQLLGDSPENPTYIETIPRRGYSFIASVEFSDLRGESRADLETTGADQEPSSDALGKLWFRKSIPPVLRATSLLFAGMILGALLAFIWFFAQVKNARAATSHRVNTSRFIGSELKGQMEQAQPPSAP
jgi:DNA-binding winged helix-turn-helix (wHTH) protein